MNVLGISGTPRKSGNSDILLQHALHPFEEAGWEVTLLRRSAFDPLIVHIANIEDLLGRPGR